MPAYDYRCRTCDTVFEVRRGLTEPPEVRTTCPSGHLETSRVFTPVAVGGVTAAPVAAAPAGGGCCGGGCCG
jgi:putative FmdB family regulatory protein